MHSVVRTHLESYLDGSLRAAARAELEAHLGGCAGCRQAVAEIGETKQWIEVLVTEPAMPAPGFYQRVRARVQAEAGQVWPFWQLMPAFGRQLGYSVAMTLLLASSYFLTLRLTEHQNTVAELMLDAPAIRAEAPAFTNDVHANRERVMLALVDPPGKVEGD